ncbi:MAG: hypothetical protein BGO67_11290 [Alphaproteobacteria bacterium 41-28]|nr:MAG: hypothetical protein BGO67_11290 [Alphaproteobacteria bacterium 41-28]
MVKKVFVVTLLASVCFLESSPLSAMQDEKSGRNVSAKSHPQSKSLKDAIQHIDEALEKKIGEDQRTLSSFSEIKELYATGNKDVAKREVARKKYLMRVGISNPRKDQQKRVVSLEQQIEYISQFYRTTIQLTTDFKNSLIGWNEGNTRYPRDNMGAYLIHVEINSFDDAVCAEFDRINKKSEVELHLPTEYNFLKDYLNRVKNETIIFLKQLSSHITPFAEKVLLEQDPKTTCEYANQLLLLLHDRGRKAIDEKELEENKPTLENKENNKSIKKKSKKKKKRHPKGKSCKPKTRAISKEVSSLENNLRADLHSPSLQTERPQDMEKEEEILLSTSPQLPKTESIVPCEEAEPKYDLLSEAEDQQIQPLSKKNESVSEVKHKLKSAKKEKLDLEQPKIDSEEKTSDKKNKKGKVRKSLSMKNYLKRKKRKESSPPPPIVHITPNPTIIFTKKAMKQFEKMRAAYARKKTQDLLNHLNSNPVGTGGLGKPKRLAGGGYSRRVTGGRRVVYDIEDSGNIVVYNTEGYHKN